MNEKQLGDPTAIEIPAEAETAAAEAAEEEQPWLRLDRRMLLVHPVNEVVKLLPVLLVSVVLGSQSGNHWWGLGVVTLLVIFGLLRYFTTTYRIGPVHVQLRTGSSRKSCSPSRVAASDPSTSRPGSCTGCSDCRSCASVPASAPGAATIRTSSSSTPCRPPWFRTYAPHCWPAPSKHGDWKPRHAGRKHHRTGSTPKSVTGNRVGFATPPFRSPESPSSQPSSASRSNTASALPSRNPPAVSDSFDSLESLGIALMVVIALVVLLVLSSALACVQYLIAFGNMKLTDNGRILHVSHGL